MKGPPGFPKQGQYVRLLKTLYGLKQSGRKWNKVLVAKPTNEGFYQCVKEPCLFVKGTIGNPNYVLLAVYMDNIAIATATDAMMQDCKYKL